MPVLPNSLSREEEFITETWTGKQVDVLWIKAEDICIEDMARSLSMTCRFNGHVDRFYSVANHCVVMAEYFMKRGDYKTAMYALLHEGDEEFLGDVITPVKYLDEMDAFRELAKSIKKVVLRRFKLYGREPKAVKTLDDRMKVAEARAVKSRSRLAATEMDTSDIKVRVWTQKTAEKKFLETFKKLEIKLSSDAA